MDEHEQDTDVALLLRRAADEAPADPDPAPVVSAAVRRGQSLRRRRAAAQWVGVLAVAASVATGMVLVHEWARQPASESLVVAPTATPSTQVITTVPPAPRGSRPVTQVYADVLAPYGEVSDLTSYPYGLAGQRMGLGLLHDGVGPGQVTVAVLRDTTVADATVACDVDGTRVRSCAELGRGEPCPEGMRCVSPDDGVADACPPAAERTAGAEACVMLADGTVVVAQTSPTYSDSRDRGELVNEATAYRPDGLQVHAMAFNGPGEKLGATRAAPTLTIDQLRAIVVDPAWADVDLGN